MTGLLVITLAIVKVLITMGIDAPFLLPLGMFLVDCFNAINKCKSLNTFSKA
jgi:hypothetical protein